MELAAEFYWVIPAAVFVGTAFAVYHGYSKKGSQQASAVFNSAIVDSAVAHTIVAELARIADAAEEIQDQMKKTAQTEDIRAVIAAELRAELAKQRKS